MATWHFKLVLTQSLKLMAFQGQGGGRQGSWESVPGTCWLFRGAEEG